MHLEDQPYPQGPLKRSTSSGNTRTSGDLNSGRAFDSGCSCHQSTEGVYNDLLGRSTVCHCGAPRLAPEHEFVKALMNIGKRLQSLPTKELRSKFTVFLLTTFCSFLKQISLLF